MGAPGHQAGRATAATARAGEPLVFQPDPSRFRRELAIGVAVYAVACPLVCWWKAPALPLVRGACAFLAGLVLLVGVPLYRVTVRGFDTIGVGEEGIVVLRRKNGFRLAWPEIARVYRFREQLVFETVAPMRRHAVHLQGHEHHEDALFDAMKGHARTLNLAWLESLTGLGTLAK
jgi:hypothetical protein